MRNRLLPLAVLAIALGLAVAAYADISVNTLIVDPAGSPVGTWDIRTKLWGDGGLGVPADNPGLYDFVAGARGDGGALVSGSANIAPMSIPDQTGFFQGGVSPLAGNGVQYLVGFQNAAYLGVHDPALDAKVLTTVGIAPGALGTVLWDADTKIGHGDHNSIGTLSVDVPGRISLSVLPTSWTTSGGPMLDIPPSVTAVVTQTMTGGSGNNGGGGLVSDPLTGYDRPTAMNVQAGALHLGSAAALGGMGQYLTLNIDNTKGMNMPGYQYQENARVVLDADQSVKDLNINYGQTYLNGLNLNGNALKVMGNGTGGDLEALANKILLAQYNAEAIPGDGIYDGSVSAAKTIGMMITDEGFGPELYIKAVQWGDVNMDGVVDMGDVFAILDNWNPAGGSSPLWWVGDLNRDTAVDMGDVFTVLDNWNPAGNPVGLAAPAPEPCSLILLAAGAVGLVRRRRSA